MASQSWGRIPLPSLPESAGNPDTLPTPNDPSGPCPRCGRISNFKVEEGVSFRLRQFALSKNQHRQEQADVLTCNGCQESTVVVTNRWGAAEHELVHVYPAPGAGALDRQVNGGVASAYDEGVRCLSIGAHRAAAVMFRSSLSLFVKDKGSDRARGERHLKTALKHMKDDGHLHRSLWGWANHLNQLGNEAAHPEDYDDVTAEEADGLSKFVRHLIRHEYEMPAQLLRDQGMLKESEPESGGDDVGADASAADPELLGGLNPHEVSGD